MPLAQRIRKDVPIKNRIISVTGADPTLLNLARRQGWLTSIENVDEDSLRYWSSLGATYMVGSFEWQESYAKISELKTKTKLENLFCDESKECINVIGSTYLIPIDNLSR